MDDSDGEVSAIDGGWLIAFRRRLKHPPAKVWAAIVEPGRMSQWFDRTEFPAELKVGAVIRFFHEKAGLESQGRITALDPPRLIAWEWTSDFSTPSLCRWEIRPDGAGCLLLMSQTTDQPGVLARTTAGWHACLEGLQHALDGRPEAQNLALHWETERYLRTLAGLAADAQIKREGSGVQARFDRTLPHPIDVVWDGFLSIGKTVDRRLGGVVQFDAEPGKSPSCTEITAYDPPKRLDARWSDGAFFRLDLLDLGGAAQITLIFYEPNGGARAMHHIAQWHAQLDHLADRLDGKPEREADIAGLADKYGRKAGRTG